MAAAMTTMGSDCDAVPDDVTICGICTLPFTTLVCMYVSTQHVSIFTRQVRDSNGMVLWRGAGAALHHSMSGTKIKSSIPK